jgi:hypothetical protein
LTEYKERREPKTAEATYIGRVVGRDKKVIDPADVFGLAEIGCNDREIADWFGIAENTLRYNFSVELTKGKEGLKQKLRRAQLRVALDGNATMLIWLGKNILMQQDNPTQAQDVKPLPWTDDEPEAEPRLTEDQIQGLKEQLDVYRNDLVEQDPHGAQ